MKNTAQLRTLLHRFMTVLKDKNHKHWKQAQARISASSLASRISGYQYEELRAILPLGIFSERLVPQGKAAAVGLAFGESVFLRKLFMPILVGGFFDSHRLNKYSAL